MLHRPRRGKRRGAAIVEMALVAGVFFLFLFGIFEYCRLLFVMRLTTNASHGFPLCRCAHRWGNDVRALNHLFRSRRDQRCQHGLATSGTTVYGSGCVG